MNFIEFKRNIISVGQTIKKCFKSRHNGHHSSRPATRFSALKMLPFNLIDEWAASGCEPCAVSVSAYSCGGACAQVRAHRRPLSLLSTFAIIFDDDVLTFDREKKVIIVKWQIAMGLLNHSGQKSVIVVRHMAPIGLELH